MTFGEGPGEAGHDSGSGHGERQSHGGCGDEEGHGELRGGGGRDSLRGAGGRAGPEDVGGRVGLEGTGAPTHPEGAGGRGRSWGDGGLWSDPLSGANGSGTGDGREVVRRHRRGRLLRAAVEVTAEVGYRNLTLRRLTAAAGMSIPTLHEHFDGVEDCLLAAYDEAVERAIALATEAYERSDGTPAERLEGALRAILRFGAEEPAAARACLVEVPGAGRAGQERHLATMRRAGELVAHALSDLSASGGTAPRGASPLPQARLLPPVLAGGILQILQQRIEEGETDRLPDLAPALAEVCTAPLAEPAPPA